ncbi:MAG: cobyrinic acid a,c-diamide synthase [Chroococcales cyanobacterium]
MIKDLEEQIASLFKETKVETMLDKLPPDARKWAEGLPWKERRYLLSLCHLLCATTPEVQAEFLDEYTADGVISKVWLDREKQEKVQQYLQSFHLDTELNEAILRRYIRQFYIHSAQDVRRQPEQYLESALRLVVSTEEKNYVLNYILGFEIMKMMFRMSWLQQERLYRLQINQEDFYYRYIKPIQYAHRINGIIQPKDEKVFFAKRHYFVQEPEITDKKVIELVMLTFTTDVVSHLGFSIARNPDHIPFDYDYIFQPEQDKIFN